MAIVQTDDTETVDDAAAAAQADATQALADAATAQAAADAAQADADDAQLDHTKILSGMLIIPNASTSVVQAVGVGYNGKIAVVSFGEAPVAAVKIWAGLVAGGNLTINIDQDNTADLDVFYILDGR